MSLYFASERLRDDKDVVMAAVQQNGMALYFASERLRDDKDVVMAAVHQIGTALYFASDELRNDKDVVLKAVQQNGMTLRYASERLRGDKDVVMAAVHQYEWALIYASKELRDDFASLYVSPRLKQDQDIQKAAGLEPDIKQEPEKPDIDMVLGDAKKWCQKHNDIPTAQPQHNIER